jgi:hypothetical protein
MAARFHERQRQRTRRRGLLRMAQGGGHHKAGPPSRRRPLWAGGTFALARGGGFAGRAGPGARPTDPLRGVPTPAAAAGIRGAPAPASAHEASGANATKPRGSALAGRGGGDGKEDPERRLLSSVMHPGGRDARRRRRIRVATP